MLFGRPVVRRAAARTGDLLLQRDGDFRAIFEATPGAAVVLAPDAPRFTILAATDAYCRDSQSPRAAMLGRAFFDVFRDARAEEAAGLERRAESDLRASFLQVLRTGRTHRPPVQRWDVRGDDDAPVRPYWQPVNAPVLSANGEVSCLVHHVEDVSAAVLAEEARAERDRVYERQTDGGG